MEANPVSILEALACGAPVVAPRVGSIPDSVADGVSGYLVEPHQAAPLAARIEELLLDGPSRHAMGRAGRQFVLEHASLSRMVEGYEHLIDFLYRRSAGRAIAKDSPQPARFAETAAV
jgi:glycosyltransferase involved in cell wall biosynthesis